MATRCSSSSVGCADGPPITGQYAVDVRAWWTYWLSIGVAAILWLGAIVLGGRQGLRTLSAQPIWLAVLLLPLIVAGVNLIAFRERHETVCRIEVGRHGWLRTMTGGGYSARTFAWTGLALLVLVALIVVAQLGGWL